MKLIMISYFLSDYATGALVKVPVLFCLIKWNSQPPPPHCVSPPPKYSVSSGLPLNAQRERVMPGSSITWMAKMLTHQEKLFSTQSSKYISWLFMDGMSCSCHASLIVLKFMYHFVSCGSCITYCPAIHTAVHTWLIVLQFMYHFVSCSSCFTYCPAVHTSLIVLQFMYHLLSCGSFITYCPPVQVSLIVL